jgi:hypothetical protein
MNKPFDATFRPLTGAQLAAPPLLPVSIQHQLREVEANERRIEYDLFKNPKRGRIKRVIYSPTIGFSADSDPELETKLKAYWGAVGKKARGNKRIGKAALYAELVQHFLLLKHKGITPPRNKSLSKKACQFGLGEILRCHGCTDLDDHVLMTNGIKRNKVAAKMDRIFSRIASFV